VGFEEIGKIRGIRGFERPILSLFQTRLVLNSSRTGNKFMFVAQF
jgi:hypothetical protein